MKSIRIRKNFSISSPLKIASAEYPDGKEVFVTSGMRVLTKGTSRQMIPCDHEEADTRLLVHVIDSLNAGCSTCLVRTVDTDVVVILIGMFHHLLTLNLSAKIWLAFGTGKNFAYFDINSISSALGKQKSLALPVFHSFIGCDTTSTFFGKGKKFAWEAWNCYTEATRAFIYIAKLDTDSQYFHHLERFTVVLYNKTNNLECVIEARMELFCQRNRPMESIIPTKDALLQHLKCVTIWTTSELTEQNRPSRIFRMETGRQHTWDMGSCLDYTAHW